jgi:CRISPR system Cascade subunit CasC
MKHLELHILQSFPVACLNRDDLNSPKTAIFGGVQRARVSSQSWKSAIRKVAKDDLPNMAGQRTKRLVCEITKRLVGQGMDKSFATKSAELAAEQISKLDTKRDNEGYLKVKTLCFLSPAELDAVATAIYEDGELQQTAGKLAILLQKSDRSETENKNLEKLLKACENRIAKKEIGKTIKGVQLKDAADIALFGRMVADDHSLTVEGAAMFSHALSTHKVDNEIDFFAAVDDLQPKEEAGAGMTGTLEFNSATYYRFAALNLDMLTDKDHLGPLNEEGKGVVTQEERRKVVEAFIRATLMAVPVARKNSMNGNTLPGFVLGIVREKGHPIQLVNAFENPVKRTGAKGLFEVSREKLLEEYKSLKETWDLDEKVQVEMPRDGLKQFIEKVVSYVR